MSKKQKWERASEETVKEEIIEAEVPSLQELMDIVEEEKTEALRSREESSNAYFGLPSEVACTIRDARAGELPSAGTIARWERHWANQLATEEVIEADAAIPQAELEALLAKEAVIEKYSIGEVCARHVPGWKAQWLPGVTAHAKFHGVNENDTVENIKSSVLSYGLLFR